jgi:REP element-mobilizing transposase RayT
MRIAPVRRSIRLKRFDYRTVGAYFVTVVTAGRRCVFGEVESDEVRVAEVGRIVESTWRSIPLHFPHVALDAFVVMPNHVHGILWLEDAVGAKHASPLQSKARGTQAGSLSAVIQSFQSASMRAASRDGGMFGGPLWQRGFYEHAIRTEDELNRLRRYIQHNPLRWALDRENSSRGEA